MSSHYYEPVAGSPRPLSGCVPTFTSMDISPRCRLPQAATVLVPSEETIRQESKPQKGVASNPKITQDGTSFDGYRASTMSSSKFTALIYPGIQEGMHLPNGYLPTFTLSHQE